MMRPIAKHRNLLCLFPVLTVLAVLTGCAGGSGGGGIAVAAEDYTLSVCIEPPADANREAIDLITLYMVEAWNGEPLPWLPQDLAVGAFDFPSILVHELGHIAGIHKPEHLTARTGVMYGGFYAGEIRREITADDFALLGAQPDVYTLEYVGLGRDCAAPITFAPLDPGDLAIASHRWGGTINTAYPWYYPDI